MTQKQLAKILHISVKSISMYERKRRTIPDEIKFKLADIYNVTLDYLLERTDVNLRNKLVYVPLPKNADAKFKKNVVEYVELLEFKRIHDAKGKM